MLKETEETLGFVVIIFVISGIQLGPPPYAYGAEQVVATEMYHERGSLPIGVARGPPPQKKLKYHQ